MEVEPCGGVEVVAAATARSRPRSTVMRRGTFKFEMAYAFKHHI